MTPIPLHAPPHANTHTCCICGWKSSGALLEVYAVGNWHPICRDCLNDIDLPTFGPFTNGRRIRQSECVGQGVML